MRARERHGSGGCRDRVFCVGAGAVHAEALTAGSVCFEAVGGHADEPGVLAGRRRDEDLMVGLPPMEAERGPGWCCGGDGRQESLTASGGCHPLAGVMEEGDRGGGGEASRAPQ